jgi:hypothetical protein
MKALFVLLFCLFVFSCDDLENGYYESVFIECTPGKMQCNVNVVELCNSNKIWVQYEDCGEEICMMDFVFDYKGGIELAVCR